MLQATIPAVSCPGVDRALWVRVELRAGQVVGGRVHGIRHRRPVDVPVPADVARRLLARGVPAIPAAGARRVS